MTCHDCGREFADDELNAADSEGRRVHLPSCDNPMKFNPREVSMPVLPPGTPKECTCSPSLNAPYDETCPIHRWYEVDMVNHPPHYRRGPEVQCPECEHRFTVQCIQVIRHIRDMRLATAVKYLWRVGFGGKADDREDVDKARWYCQDWLDNPIDPPPLESVRRAVGIFPMHNAEPQSAVEVGLLTPEAAKGMAENPGASYHYLVSAGDPSDPSTLLDNPDRVGIVCICDHGSPMIKPECPADRHRP
ncbi:hypothetical protein PHAEDRUS_53 [Mycobacterium phage Phaedrus]|uniref:hypothetical protein n=1 Tax=Mycobacterium phage Phaedrus TaxID=546184 RepID=UPI00017992CA|nr:hypothetical protein PHAEDRUS_53 [Mycobacterium phage Phaedrus]ACF34017.1 hypothetical protein PHAEDRUS_53 [Mycobacterium phage Phaedrus]